MADDSDVEMIVAKSKEEDESDQLDSDDDDEDIAVDPAKPVKVKTKTRKGANITSAMKGDWKKKTKVSCSRSVVRRLRLIRSRHDSSRNLRSTSTPITPSWSTAGKRSPPFRHSLPYKPFSPKDSLSNSSHSSAKDSTG